MKIPVCKAVNENTVQKGDFLIANLSKIQI